MTTGTIDTAVKDRAAWYGHGIRLVLYAVAFFLRKRTLQPALIRSSRSARNAVVDDGNNAKRLNGKHYVNC